MSTSKECILVVESDNGISDLIVHQTLQPAGYQVTLAEEAGEAIQQVSQFAPDFNLGKAVASITHQRALFDKIVESAVRVTEADIG